MTLIHRAVRRAALPVKYSAGFHPAPRISFGDALPLGVASEAELIDLELSSPCQPQEAMLQLNQELPEGVRVLKAESWPRKGEAPANSIHAATYKVSLPEDTDDGLEERLDDFLGREAVITTRTKKNLASELDLRPWVLDLKREGSILWMKMNSGSPLFLAAYLLEKDVELVRAMGIHKTAIDLKHAGTEAGEQKDCIVDAIKDE
jgi:radical SAM-linked protein